LFDRSPPVAPERRSWFPGQVSKRLTANERLLMPIEPRPNPGDSTEVTRVKLFLGMQFFFLVVSIFTGGFNFKLWSMLDTALMLQSIGVTSLVLVLEEAKLRRLAFRVAVIIYLLAILDMGINVLISGVVGWKT
jgi:hypothetical protein